MLIFKAKEYQSEKSPIIDSQMTNEHKNNKITPKNVSQKGLQSLPDVLQHPVDTKARRRLTTYRLSQSFTDF